MKIHHVYLGSSHARKETTYDANNHVLLSFLGYGSCNFKSVDLDLTRNEKVAKIINWREKTGISLQLKVCWKRKVGINCSQCEKCYRTIMNIISNHGNPNDYGFNCDKEILKNI